MSVMDIRQKLFQYRSYAPFPFIVVMILFARPIPISLLFGFPVVAAGEYLRLWGVAIAGSETRTTGPVGGTYLITTGPFAYVRNPLYVGNILMYVGAGIMSNALFPWLVMIVLFYFGWQYSLIVSLEEEHLAEKFGEEYDRYCKSVPRFVLSLNKFTAGENEQPVLDWKRGLISEKRTLQAVFILTVVMISLWFAQR